jgi:hypothetical protein
MSAPKKLPGKVQTSNCGKFLSIWYLSRRRDFWVVFYELCIFCVYYAVITKVQMEREEEEEDMDRGGRRDDRRFR